MKKFILFVMLVITGISAMAQWTVQGIPYNNPKIKNSMPKVMPMATTNDSFSFDDIQNWTGEGENQAAVVIQFNTGKESETNALVFGFRWNGTATGTDMIVAIAKEDPRFYVLANNGSYGYSIGGIGWDADEDGDIYLKNGDQTFTLTDGKYECSSEYDYDSFTAGDADDLWAGGWFSGYWSYWVASDSPANFGYASTGASGRVLTDGCWDGWNFSANYGSYAWLPFAAAPSLIPAGATTQFKVDGIYYTLDGYQKKTVMVSAPFEMENQEKTTYTGDIEIPSTFTHEDVVYTVVGIADDAFAGTQIGKVELPETVTAIGKHAFQNSTLTSINVTDNITKIGVAAFSGCSNVTEYKLPTSITSIPDELYKGTAITAVTFSETIESIGVSAFENCTKITTLDIPATLKAIGASAFADCEGLKNVKVNTIAPLAITEDVFSAAAYENATLTVPIGYTAIYAATTGWKNFKKVEEVAIPVAQGDNFYVGNVAYNITAYSESAKEVIVTHFPVESVSDNNIKAANLIGYVGDVVVPAKVSYQNIEFIVNGVTAQAFMGAEEMTSIKFNCALTSIPERALFSCKKLTSIEIPATVTTIESKAFEQCQALTTITLPQGLLNIGSRAFYSCKTLENINLPSSLTLIGDYIFYDCDALTSIEFPESITVIPANVCYDCKTLVEVKFGSQVATIGGNAFQYCESLKAVELPTTLISMGNSAFANTALESITIPASLKTIPNRAFEKTPLQSVTMSDEVTSLGDYVFNSCASLESIKLPASLITLGKNAFSSCTSLKSITIPDSVTSIWNYTFQKCTSIETITLPTNLTTLGTYAFDGCSAIKSIVIPEGVTAISNYTFRNCSALESITLGSKVKSIGNYAFYGCSSLKVLELPETISTLGSNLTVGATNLSVYVCNATPFTWNNSFKISNEAYAPIYVIYGAKADYEVANNWNLSAVNEVIPSISVDMENQNVSVDYYNALLTILVIKTYAETIPTRFIEVNNVALNNEIQTFVKFREADSEDEYTSVEAVLNEDGTYTVDLLDYLEDNTRYEYYWEIALGENEPAVSPLDYFTTEYLVTRINEVNIDNMEKDIEYYNVQGIKVSNPQNGIYIKKQGSKTTKVIIK